VFFTSVQVSDVADDTVFNTFVLDSLIPVLDTVLRQIPVSIPLPPTPTLYSGTYESDVIVTFNRTSGILSVNDGLTLSFVSIVKVNTTVESHIFSSITSSKQVCRWLDDGSSGEYWYFTVINGAVTETFFMGDHYAKISPSSSQTARQEKSNRLAAKRKRVGIY